MARGTMRALVLLALCSGAMGQTFFLAQATFVFPMSFEDFEASGADVMFTDVIITMTVVSVEDFSMVYQAQVMWNGGRRLLTNATSNSTRIGVSIKAANETTADVIASRLTAGAINLELAKVSLPNVTVLVPAFVKQGCHLAAVDLGLAAPFAVLATSSVTDAGGSQINGDMGVTPGATLPTYAAYSPGTPGLNGTKHFGPEDSTANLARAAAITALLVIHSRSDCLTATIGYVELGGRTLGPGLYTSSSYMQIDSGHLILDAGMGDTGAISDAVFIFRAATLLTMKAGMRVILRGGASPSNIYWSAGTGGAFAANSVMQGNVFSGTAGITYAAGCIHHGRAFAIGTAITLSSTEIGLSP
eukprot:CAMPEP_0173098102 /NCGR_PEP_ID=MMETSP1102-20130122/34470_1 /TAXON_ID=49646 /ORGANISM="Geminigera sp., Strain Caron Lab Isolate" /LENGTH=359 /DNA_ID=CAMNT_0013990413 /DNA_START=19 /DNA_END=1098 /DNA_ORIENTATION=+